MSMIVLVVLVFAAMLAVARGRRGPSLLVLAAVLLWLFLVGNGLLPRWALAGLQTTAPARAIAWRTRNVIVLLGVGTVRWPGADLITSHTLAYSRMHEAARLYFECSSQKRICKILTTGGDPSGTGRSEAEIMGQELTNIGVASADLLVEPKSLNTFENARLSTDLLRGQDFEQGVLVTSGLHMKRSLLYFSQFNLALVPAPAERLVALFTPLLSAHNFTYLDLALHEYAGLARYQLYSWLGWNPQVEHAGSP